ncbi:MAG: hypothetical protein ACRCV3_00935 [Desulfovibrionaceae bacterium]
MRKTSKFTIFISSIIVLFFCITVGITVWLGVEKARLAYDVGEYRKRHKNASEFLSKLDTERELLSSPSRLRKFAKKEGLSPAQSGQVRKIIIEIPAKK